MKVITADTDWSALRPVLWESVGQTLLMVSATIILGGLFGLVLGVLLNTTRRGGIMANPRLKKKSQRSGHGGLCL